TKAKGRIANFCRLALRLPSSAPSPAERAGRALPSAAQGTESGKRCSRRKPKSSSCDSSGLVTQNHRPRPELMAAHQPQIEPLAQAGEQRRPVARQDGLDDKLVLIDQSQIRQGQRELLASHEQPFARLPLELLSGFPQVPPHELSVPIDPVQVARHDVLLSPGG